MFILPPKTDKPTEVISNLYLNEVSEISLANETYTLVLLSELRWRDPRLAFKPEDVGTNYLQFFGDVAHEILNNIWVPPTNWVNTYRSGISEWEVVTIYSDGLVIYQEYEAVSARYDADLRAFPFDVQTLTLILADISLEPGDFVLQPSDFSVEGRVTKFLPSEYVLKGLHQEVTNLKVTSDVAQHSIIYTITVARKSQGYISYYMAPLAFLVFISWTTFFMMNTPLHDRLKVVAISLLSIVTFMLFVNRFLPHVPYLTSLGFYYALIWILPICAMIEALLVQYAQSKGNLAWAARLEAVSRWMYPFSYVILTAAVVIYAFIMR